MRPQTAPSIAGEFSELRLPATTGRPLGSGDGAAHRFKNDFVYGGVPLMEFHDQEWFPKLLRDYVTDGLQFVFNFVQIYRPVVPRLSKAIRRAKTGNVVDLCSGGGGPWLWLRGAVQKASASPVTVCMTDKYPNIPAFESLQRETQDQVTFHSEPVNASRLPKDLAGFRTIFASFHHFQPHEALAILRDAVSAREGIGAFEVARRQPLAILGTTLMLLGGLLAAPFIRPFRFSRLLWTYLLPVIPLVLFYDGIISCLRAYSTEELAELVSKVEADDYVWEIGEERGWLAPITYLVGYPKVVIRTRQFGAMRPTM